MRIATPCHCRAYAFPHREGGGECAAAIERRYAQVYWAGIFRAIGLKGGAQ